MSEKKPYIQLPVDEIAHSGEKGERKLFRVKPESAQSVLEKVSELGREREEKDRKATSEAPTKPKEE